MKTCNCDINTSYYTTIENIKLYIDTINSRVKIVEYKNISVQLLEKVIKFSISIQIGKIICFCDMKVADILKEAGFVLEGKIDGYLKGIDAFCMSYFIESDRKNSSDIIQKDLMIKHVRW